MKLVEIKCKNCGSTLKVNPDSKLIKCDFCKAEYALDDEVQKIKYVDMEQSGYEFEKGRIKAQKEEKERALDSKCPSCGGKVIFEPSIGKWKCEYCKSEFELEALQKNENNIGSKKNNEDVKDDSYNEYVEYHCKNCGAKIIADENTASTFCVYCGNTAVLKSKLSGKFAPSRIIPFKKTKEQAIEAFKSLYKGRPLMPKFFNDPKNIEKISGVYIPFWLFSFKNNVNYEGSAKKITTWVVGDTHYTKTDTYKVERNIDMDFDGVPVDGSTRFADDIMNTIEPFNYKEMVKYNHAYLSGFLAEKYDVESDVSKEIAISRVHNSVDKVINDSLVGYSIKTKKVCEYKDDNTKTEYVLLPVWMVNVKYSDKYYTFAMNAQTGEFVGNIPIDKKKAIIMFASIFAGVTILVIIISYLIFLFGGN